MSDTGVLLRVRVPPDISLEECEHIREHLDGCIQELNSGRSTFILLRGDKSNGVEYDYDVEVLSGDRGRVEIVRSLEE